MSVRDHQLDPAEAPGETASVGRPARRTPSSLVPTSIPIDFPIALAIDRRRHYHADVDDPAGLPDPLGQCVQPQ